MLLVGLVVLGFGFSYSDLLLRLYGGGAHLAVDGGTGTGPDIRTYITTKSRTNINYAYNCYY